MKKNRVKTKQQKREAIIPPAAIADPTSCEILRAWVANQTLDVSLVIPGEWGKNPEYWGIVLADLMHHLANAYHKDSGLDPAETIQRIHELMATELSSRSASTYGDFIQERHKTHRDHVQQREAK